MSNNYCDKNLNKIFIDCGANRGQSIHRFRDLFEDHEEFEIYCFEPHQEVAALIDLYPNKGIVHPVAVSDREGTQDFYEGPSTLGSTFYKDKVTGNISHMPTPVACIDLTSFIANKFTIDDFIVLKLNVEGSEFPILERLLRTGVINWIDILFVQWHHMKIPSISEERYFYLLKMLHRSTCEVREGFWK